MFFLREEEFRYLNDIRACGELIGQIVEIELLVNLYLKAVLL